MTKLGMDTYSLDLFSEQHSTCSLALVEKFKHRCIVKTSKQEFPNAVNLIEKEYKDASLFHSGIMLPLLLEKEDGVAQAVYEDFGGRPLPWHNEHAFQKPFLLLTVAVQLAGILESIHKRFIALSYLTPHHIFLNSNSLEVRLLFPAYAITEPINGHDSSHVRLGAGYLQYLAPEQTGRLDKKVDAKSDLYALGAILYELCSGRPVVPESAPEEQLLFHLNKDPAPLSSLSHKIPKPVCRIIERLLAKEPRKRYQNAHDLRLDLEAALNTVRSGASPETAILDTKKPPPDFRNLKKLVGRDQELEALQNAWHIASKGKPQAVFVSGVAGVGKTSLVKMFTDSLPQDHLFFASGKIEATGSQAPFDALAQAVSGLVSQALTLDDDSLKDIQEYFQAPFYQAARNIVDLAPEAATLFSASQDSEVLLAEDSIRRVHLALEAFFSGFGRRNRPLLLFVDDLQWADEAMIGWIQDFLARGISSYCLFVGTFREEEVPLDHPIRNLATSPVNKGQQAVPIMLQNLDLKSITNLTMACTDYTGKKANNLAVRVHEWTGGNPLYALEALSQNISESATWPVLDIHDFSGPDRTPVASQGHGSGRNIILQKLKAFPQETCEALGAAAVCGNPFRAEMAADLLDLNLEIYQDHLAPTLDQHVLYTQIQGKETLLRFSHDSFAQVALEFLEARRMAYLHCKAGFMLSKKKKADAADAARAAGHFKEGINAITSRQNRMEAAKVCRIAGLWARKKGAFAKALEYLETGMELTGAGEWESSHDLMMDLHVQAAEAARLCADKERSGELVQAAMAHTKNSVEKARILRVHLESLLAEHQLEEAVDAALDALNVLGIKIPRNPNRLHVLTAWKKATLGLPRNLAPKINNLPKMTDPVYLAAMPIVLTLAMSAYSTRPFAAWVALFKALAITIKHGLAVESSAIFAAYGVFLCSLNKMDQGYEMGQLALSTQESESGNPSQGYTLCLYHCMIQPWKESINAVSVSLKSAYKRGLLCGSHEWACVCEYVRGYILFGSGIPLDRMERLMQQSSWEFQQIGQSRLKNYSKLDLYMVRCLMGKNRPEEDVTLAYQDPEKERLLVGEKDAAMNFIFYFNKMFMNFMLGDLEQAKKSFKGLQENYSGAEGAFGGASGVLYEALVLLANIPRKGGKRKQLQQIRKLLKKLENWANHAPMNFQHKYELVGAELQRVYGQPEKAVKLYENAILGARRYGVVHEEALASELAARFMLSIKKTEKALLLLGQARLLYLIWGGHAKVAQLDRKYGLLFKPVDLFETNSMENQGATSMGNAPFLYRKEMTEEDVRLFVQQVKPDQAISRIVALASKNLAAQKCVLFALEKGELALRCMMDNDQISAGTESIDSDQLAPQFLIRYVFRTNKSLNFSREDLPDFVKQDPYLIAGNPGSVLCAPVRGAEGPIGVLYFENRSLEGLFKEDSVEISALFTSILAEFLE